MIDPEPPWVKQARKQAEAEQAMISLGEAILRSPYGRLCRWLVHRLADACCRFGFHAWPKQRTLESDEFCLHCAERRKTSDS